jgi:hypothetical protein
MIRWHATEESAIIVAVNDEALSRLHQRRPAGVALHLRGAESLARGLDGFTRFEPSIAADLKLPDLDRVRVAAAANAAGVACGERHGGCR